MKNPKTTRLIASLLVAAAMIAAGCMSAPTTPASAAPPTALAPQTLQPGDVVKISFPGAANLDTTQQIRRDGFINLSMIGEIEAAGKTPAELQKQLIDRYATQLVSKEVNVTIASTAFAVYVTGAVNKPGKITPNRSLTALDAVMEAGGFDSEKANTKAVVVIRKEGGRTKNYVLNLQAVLDGTSSDAFYLQPDDIVYVKEKFSFF